MNLRGLLSILFSICTLLAHSQNLSNKGTDFWVGYGHHQFFESGGNTQVMLIYISTEQAANVTINVNGTAYNQTVSIPANTVYSLNTTNQIPKSGPDDARLFSGTPGFTGNNSEGISSRGIHITSNVPVVVYAHTYGSASSGATMLMPTNTWGYAYTSLNSAQSYATNCFSYTYVIAKENNTKVRITPAVPTRDGKPANVPFDVVLNRGQIYQVLGALQSGSVGFEMTGTTVKSIPNSNGECFPIAVFSGSSRTSNPLGCGTGGGDNDMQQLFPSQAWGKKYAMAPLSGSTSIALNQTNGYKILVKDPGTVVLRNGAPIGLPLINGLYYQFESNQPEYITADKPIMVAQFMSGGSTCLAGGVGDPEMIYISPLEQGIKRLGFYRNNLQAITVNYLTMVIPTAGINSLTINGVNPQTLPATEAYIYDHFYLPGYKIVIRKWPAAQGQVIVQSDSAFTGVTYGLGSVESYGYNAGTNINNLNAYTVLQNTPDSSGQLHPNTCKGTPSNIFMQVPYKPQNIFWQVSQVSAISPNSNINETAPMPTDSLQIAGIWYYQYQMPGSYTFSDTGTFQIPVINTLPFGFNNFDGCGANTEIVTLTVTVKPKPVANFSFTHTGCVKDSVQFTSAATTSNNYTIATWNWNFGDGQSGAGQNISHLYTASGPQNVQLNIMTPIGCIGDTIKPINIFPAPSAAFGISSAALCEGGTVTFTDSASYAGSAPVNKWFWDFGISTLNAPNGSPQNINYLAPGTYTVKHVVGVSPTCISDTVTKVLTIWSKPQLGFTYPAGCLPTDGNVQFTSTTTVPDGQTMSYSWNFGHPASGANNTSTLANPTHNYPYGNFTITYSVTTNNGCTKDTSVAASFNLAPSLAFSPLSPVCASVAGTVSVANGSVTNGVQGTGTYKGPGTSASGSFSPSTAGAGTHTIWYVYAANGGCVDSISQTITVYPKPVSNFSLSSNAVCLNQPATITDNSTIASGSISTWNWNFGNNTTASNTNNSPFPTNYSTPGNYTIKLVTVSDNNCVSDTVSRTIAVSPMPVAGFTMPASVCMPGSVQFTNTSSISNNAALTYQWTFGDTNGSTSTSPSHPYATSGSYTVTLIAKTAEGCADTTSQVFNSFYEKPVANFSVTPDVICQGADNNFYDLSTAANSTVTSWNWSFGDGSTMSTQNPVKRYSLPGTYAVSLTVTNAQGCVSVPFVDSVTVFLQPVIDAGPSFTVLEGTIVTFNPTVNDTTISFLWTPSGSFSDPTVLRPSIVALVNQKYTLTATGDNNCTASDTLWVRILKPVTVPNAFSPNGDGIHDTWVITNLADYPDATVEVYNRYGQMVYQSYRYNKPWDGTHNGRPLPVATYYYVVNLRSGFKPLTGSITIIR